jgi:hypothetical protein
MKIDLLYYSFSLIVVQSNVQVTRERYIYYIVVHSFLSKASIDYVSLFIYIEVDR